MTKPENNIKPQAVDNSGSMPKTSKKKPGFFKRLLSFTHLAKELGEFTFDESKAGDNIKKDILSIESERIRSRSEMMAEQERLAKEQILAKNNNIGSVLIDEKSNMSSGSVPELSTLARPNNDSSWYKEIDDTKIITPDNDVKIKDDVTGDEPIPLPPSIIEQHKVDTEIPAPLPPLPPSNKPIAGAPANIKSMPVVEQKHSDFETKTGKAKKFAQELKQAMVEVSRDSVENRSWQPLNMVRANLVKDQQSLFYNWTSKLLGLVFSACLAVLIVLIAYGSLFYWQTLKDQGNEGLIANVDATKNQIKIEEAKMQDVIKLNSGLLYVAYLLDNHIYWTNFFSLLEDRTTKNVYFEKFSSTVKGNFKMPGVARDNASAFLESDVFKYNDDPLVLKSEPTISGPFSIVLSNPNNVSTQNNAIASDNNEVLNNITNTGVVVVSKPVVNDDRVRFVLDAQISPQMLLYKCYTTYKDRCNLKAEDKKAEESLGAKPKPYACPYFSYATDPACK